MRTFITFICCCFTLACAGAGVFDTLKLMPAKSRITKAQEIYDKQIKFKDSSFSISSLLQLQNVADDLNDKSLSCFAVSLLADQYARFRGFNTHSTQLHTDAISMAENYNLPVMKGICTYRTGRYYYNFKNYPMAFEYLLKADNDFKALGYTEVPDIGGMLFILGSIYYETGDYEKSQTYLQKIQGLSSVGVYLRKQSLNTLAMISKQLHDTAGAMHYFELTLHEALKEPDSTWIGIAEGNIGTLLFHQGKYSEAYPLLEESYRLGIKNHEWSDVFNGLLMMARIDIMQHKTEIGKKKIDQAVAFESHFFTINARRNLYEAEALYYTNTGQSAKAIETENKLMMVKDSIAFNKDQQAYKKIQLRIETENHLAEIKRIEAQSKTSAMIRNGVIVVLLLLIIVLFLVYSSYRLKAKNQAISLKADKLRAEEKLKYARQLLQNFTENTKQKNELIDRFAIEFEQLKRNLINTDPQYTERLQDFEKLVHSSILNEQEWNDFRGLFEKVHKGFFSRLAQQFPGLSQEDTRMLALIRLGLGNTEIAKMLRTDDELVTKAKERLRNSIDNGKNQSIEDIIQAI